MKHMKQTSSAWLLAKIAGAKQDGKDHFSNAIVYGKYGHWSNARMSFEMALYEVETVRLLNAQLTELKRCTA